MENRKLSICIPTFNRSTSLELLLYRLKSESNCCNVEIIVSDNASTDQTQLVCKNFHKIYNNFIYVRNQINIGFHNNLLNVMNLANYEYIWILSDDDIPVENSINKLLDFLFNNDAGWILSNFKKNNNNSSYFNKKSCRLNINELLNEVGIWSSFISISVVKNSLFKEWYIQNNKITNNDYVGLNICLYAGYLEGCIFRNEPLVCRPLDHISKHRFLNYETYLIDFYKAIEIYIDNNSITNKTKSKLLNQFAFGIGGLSLIKHIFEKNIKPNITEINKIYKYKLSYWIFLLPINYFNIKLLKFIVKVVKYLLFIISPKKWQKINDFL